MNIKEFLDKYPKYKNRPESMKIDLEITKTIPKTKKTLDIAFISDTHIGSENFDYISFFKNLNWLLEKENKHYLLLLLGDLIDFGLEKKNPEAYYNNFMTLTEQYEFLIDYFSQFKKRIIGSIEGNHELRSKIHLKNNHELFDIHSKFCSELKIKNLENRAIIKLNLKRYKSNKQISYLIYAKHGSGNTKSTTTRYKKLFDMSNIIMNIDIYCIAHIHTHIQDYRVKYFYNPLTNIIEPFVQHFICSGHSLKYGNSYSEREGYYPSGKSNHRRVHFYIDKKKIKVE